MNPAVKRLSKELAEIAQEELITARPLEDNLFEWHFQFPGPNDSPYSTGSYHGRLLFPSNYPFSPPSISFLTPNGRWEVERKICLSVTGYHPELWQPAWSVRTILLALREHMRVDDRAAIGYLDYSEEVRKDLAKKSLKWRCSVCGGGGGGDGEIGKENVDGKGDGDGKGVGNDGGAESSDDVELKQSPTTSATSTTSKQPTQSKQSTPSTTFTQPKQSTLLIIMALLAALFSYLYYTYK